MLRIKLFSLAALLLSLHAHGAENLPRVLILGDNAYANAAREVGQALKGRAMVISKEPGDTGAALQHIDEVLGKEKWDVILFNFGQADLLHKDPSTQAVRALSKSAGGVRVTTPEQFQQNLGELLKRLQATGAKLIWSNCLPMASASENIYEPGSEVEYNALAAKIMTAHNIPTNDLYALIQANGKEKKGKGNPLNALLVQGISSALSQYAAIK